MANGQISLDRVISKLDEYLNKNDTEGAKKHLHYWLEESISTNDQRAQLLLRNELMGFYRKSANREKALENASSAMSLIDKMGVENQLGAATTYLNVATVYKSFEMSKKAIPVFEKARKIYEENLEKDDSRHAGLYNNMALALVDEKRFCEAYELYERAIQIAQKSKKGNLEAAITHLNLASAYEAELGLVEADEKIQQRLEKARTLLENYERRDGYYAFVCEKCATVFGYYGHFFYENELKERAKKIYEGN